MRQTLCILLAICTLLATPAVSFAWNAAGHMLVALVAYEKMTEPRRQALVAILKKHPRFEEDFKNRMPPEVKSESQAVQDKWIFLHAATWPDIARGFKDDLRKKYHHGHWHYINVPIFLTDADRTAMQGRLPVPLEREWSAASPADPQNIAQAYRKCMHDLTNAGANDQDKAVALCWVLHLVGDVHQPLHAVALFSRDRFPGGDHGGNFILTSDGKSLHSYWDGLMGIDTSLPTLTRLFNELKTAPGFEGEGSSAANAASFDKWIDESFKLADQQVYTTAMRKIVKETDDSEEGVTIRVGNLTAQYEKEAHTTAHRRIVEAGFRVAKAIESVAP